MKKTTIYLAGGFHSNWQDKVMYNVTSVDGHYHFINPKEMSLDPDGNSVNMAFDQFTFWDMEGIRNSDIVFVYSERDNPGVGYIAELGYAKGLGKTVLLVLEEGNDYIKDRYLSFMKCMSDVVFDSLDDAIVYLDLLKGSFGD